MPDLVLKYLATDRRTLRSYLNGVFPDDKQLKSNLFLAARENNTGLPDYYYRNNKQRYLGECSTVSSIILKVFDCLTKDKLQWRDSRIHVRLDVLPDWQNLITGFPALPLLSYAIFRKYGADLLGNLGNRQKLYDIINTNLYATALPHPFHPVLHDLAVTEGLHEIHMHLNGTTEADIVWLDALQHPDGFYKNLRDKWKKDQKVQEQYEQLEPGLTPMVMLNRLRLAAALRKLLIDQCLGFNQDALRQHLLHYTRQAALQLPSLPSVGPLHRHPLDSLTSQKKRIGPLDLEAQFHLLAFDHLTKKSDQFFAGGYHLYLLLQGTFQQFVVQQQNQCGFDQFQRITINEFRSEIEAEYARRFRQLAGNGGTCPASIEGRFAPKETVPAMVQLIRRIVCGYAQYLGIRGYDYDTAQELPSGLPELKLIVHFIKEKEDIQPKLEKKLPHFLVRHHKLRGELNKKAWVVLTCREIDWKFRELLVGIDDAANELHAPPEVFAPVYRRFRRHGMVNFTYHVGEDFVHLLSGLRSIWEAVDFLEFSTGNRIGHATAAGIDPEFWLNAVENSITIDRSEWLDNLIFAYHMIFKEPEGQRYLERLRHEIECHAPVVYGSNPSLFDLLEAWKMRRLDPLRACNPGRNKTDSIRRWEWEEWEMIDAAQGKQGAFKLFMHYHLGRKKQADAHDDLIPVDVKVVDAALLALIQRLILRELKDKGIVIETMPTSNLRISYYRNFEEHHIWRWLEMENSERPTLCIGSDDPGIFSTHLYNEYAHVFQGLKSHRKKSGEEAVRIIEGLARNARRYRFSK